MQRDIGDVAADFDVRGIEALREVVLGEDVEGLSHRELILVIFYLVIAKERNPV